MFSIMSVVASGCMRIASALKTTGSRVNRPPGIPVSSWGAHLTASPMDSPSQEFHQGLAIVVAQQRVDERSNFLASFGLGAGVLLAASLPNKAACQADEGPPNLAPLPTTPRYGFVNRPHPIPLHIVWAAS